MEFKNKNVVITGGSTGIGFATAKAFIEEGARVLVTGRNTDNLEKAAKQVESENFRTLVSDTSNLQGIAVLEEYVSNSGIKIDILFLNAGVAIFAPIAQMTEEDFDYQFNTNVKGYYFTLQKLMPFLAEGATVIFTSSTVATTAQSYASVYSATKGAVNKLAQIAANELAEKGIRVNIVSPGPTKTEGFEKAVADEETKKQFASSTAVKRLGDPLEVANAVLFLASEKATFITGTELLVDGGYINYTLQ